MSLIDDALSEHTEGLLVKAQAAKDEYETARAQAASQSDLIKAQTEQLEKAKEDNLKLLSQLSDERSSIETQQLALNAAEVEIRKRESDNEATAQVLIGREQTIKAAEEKLAQDKNIFESAKADHMTDNAKIMEAKTSLDKQQQLIEEMKAEQQKAVDKHANNEAQLRAYALEISQKEEANKAKEASLVEREAELAKKEGLQADMSKMFSDKKDTLKQIEDSLLAQKKDLDDREAGIKAQEEALAKREAKLKVKEKD